MQKFGNNEINDTMLADIKGLQVTDDEHLAAVLVKWKEGPENVLYGTVQKMETAGV